MLAAHEFAVRKGPDDVNGPSPLPCPVCAGRSTRELSTLLARSMRSDGVPGSTPLRKWHCPDCGLAFAPPDHAPQPYARSNGTSPWELGRHRALAQGLHAVVSSWGTTPSSVLEVGCASGATLRELAHLLPSTRFTGIDPYPELPAPSVPGGPGVFALTLAQYAARSVEHDLVFSNHVVEHNADLGGFLRDVLKVLGPHGTLLTVCPRADVPRLDLLFSDHLLHLTRHAVETALHAAGLDLLAHFTPAWDDNSQCFVARRAAAAGLPPVERAAQPDTGGLLVARQQYLQSWARLDDALDARCGPGPLVLFGAGEASQLLAAYAPRTFGRVRRVVVDDLNGARALGRPLQPFQGTLEPGEVLLLGIHPARQAMVAQRMAALGLARVVAWDDLVPTAAPPTSG